MKSDIGKIFLLLDKCLPHNPFLKKTLQIERITEMKEYRELKLFAPAEKIFNSLLSEDKLKGYNLETLSKVYNSVPMICPAIEAILNTIHSGDISEINSSDKPNYLDPESLQKTLKKFSEFSEIENYTNIDDNNFEAIFEPETEKSISAFANTLSSDEISNIYTVIQEKYDGKNFCIPASEISNLKQELINILPTLNQRNKLLKNQKRSFSLLKVAYCILSGLLLFLLTALSPFYGIDTIVYLLIFILPLSLLMFLG